VNAGSLSHKTPVSLNSRAVTLEKGLVCAVNVGRPSLESPISFSIRKCGELHKNLDLTPKNTPGRGFMSSAYSKAFVRKSCFVGHQKMHTGGNFTSAAKVGKYLGTNQSH